MSVDLPEPDGPHTTTTWPFSTFVEQSFSTWKVPYHLLTFLNSIIAIFRLGRAAASRISPRPLGERGPGVRGELPRSGLSNLPSPLGGGGSGVKGELPRSGLSNLPSPLGGEGSGVRGELPRSGLSNLPSPLGGEGSGVRGERKRPTSPDNRDSLLKQFHAVRQRERDHEVHHRA